MRQTPPPSAARHTGATNLGHRFPSSLSISPSLAGIRQDFCSGLLPEGVTGQNGNGRLENWKNDAIKIRSWGLTIYSFGFLCTRSSRNGLIVAWISAKK